MSDFLSAVTRTILMAGGLLAAGVLPPLIAGVVLQYVTSRFRLRCAEVFGTRLCIWATAPGVMLHEFSHAFFCLVFQHKIKDFVLFSPRKDGNLGWVAHEWDPRSLWQNIGCFFIGTAPLVFGVATIAFLTLLLLPYKALPFPELPDAGLSGFLIQFHATFLGLCGAWVNPEILANWRFWFWLYAMIAIGSQITLSRADLAGARSGVLVLFGGLAVVALVLAALLPQGMRLPAAAIRCSAAICGLLFHLLLLFGAVTLLLMVCRPKTVFRQRPLLSGKKFRN